MKMKWKHKCFICIFPSLIGVTIFSILPFIKIIYYSFIESQFSMEFVGFDNYIEVLTNEYFLLALKNSMVLIIHCIPLLIVISVALSLFFTAGIKKNTLLQAVYILPMVIPTAGIVVIWRLLFNWSESCIAMDSLFIWKNVGITVILLTAEFLTIPDEVYEAASLEGASKWCINWHITIPMATPIILFTILLGIMNSYKIFKESYLYYGTNYPPDYAYTLQYYMNNHFMKLNYQNLAVSSVITAIISFIVIVIGFRLIRR